MLKEEYFKNTQLSHENMEKWNELLDNKESIAILKKKAKMLANKEMRVFERFFIATTLFCSSGMFFFFAYFFDKYIGANTLNHGMLLVSGWGCLILQWVLLFAKNKRDKSFLNKDETKFLMNFEVLDDETHRYFFSMKNTETKGVRYNQYIEKIINEERDMMKIDYDMLNLIDKIECEKNKDVNKIKDDFLEEEKILERMI